MRRIGSHNESLRTLPTEPTVGSVATKRRNVGPASNPLSLRATNSRGVRFSMWCTAFVRDSAKARRAHGLARPRTRCTAPAMR
jgi:hypothetical protein